MGNKRTEQKRRARSKLKNWPGAEQRPGVPFGGKHGICKESVYSSLYEDPGNTVKVIVCVHRNGEARTTVAASPDVAVGADVVIPLAEQAKLQTIREAREKGLLKEN